MTDNQNIERVVIKVNENTSTSQDSTQVVLKLHGDAVRILAKYQVPAELELSGPAARAVAAACVAGWEQQGRADNE
jgi:hypothetical protein